jgi:hypothetical protein
MAITTKSSISVNPDFLFLGMTVPYSQKTTTPGAGAGPAENSKPASPKRAFNHDATYQSC